MINSDVLKKATADEAKKFEEFYIWLQKSMPKEFYAELSEDWIAPIVHSLMAFKLQDFYSEIHLKHVVIALAIDNPEADLRILERTAFYDIKSFTTYVSKAFLPFPEASAYLRLAIIQLSEPFIQTQEKYSVEQKKQLVELFRKKHPSLSEANIEAEIEKMDPKFLRLMPIERQEIALELFQKAKSSDLCQYRVEYEKDWAQKEASSMIVTLAWQNTPKYNFLYRLARMVYNHGLVMQRVNMAYIDSYKKEGIMLLSFSLYPNNLKNRDLDCIKARELSYQSKSDSSGCLGINGIGNVTVHEACDVEDFLKELVLLKFFGSFDIFDATFVQTKLLSGNKAHLLRTMRYFIHQMLVHVDPNLYSLTHIEEALCRHPELTIKLLESFEIKFHPQKSDIESFEKYRTEFIELVNLIDTGDQYHDQRRKNTLLQAMNFVQSTLKTNFYVKNKTALAFRIEGTVLDRVPFDRKKNFPELPYGIFFMKGMHFFGFHIRFRDLARGGLRTVFPERKERVIAEINSVFQECYNLAFTQQKKNKDIPEGGAKGVIFLKPNERLEMESKMLARELFEAGYDKEKIAENIKQFQKEQKLEYLYQTQRSFVRSFLSLINCEPDGTLRENDIIDYLGRPEYIYLGPDENLHDVMIEWIASESKKVNYRPQGAFISGKPELGINHKEYGVTSLGVMVFMHETLKFLGIDPNKDAFTVKMTGGPDGDVAGNMIHNFYHHYTHTAKLLALTDVSGTIYDPCGLDLRECEHLFKEGKSIRNYPPEKLNPGGFLLDREQKKEITPYSFQTLLWRNDSGTLVSDWLSGNEMNALYRHNVHSVKTDIFLPCGGRPRTLHDTNVMEFLDATSTPTSKAIVEGANLYITQWARRFLEERGVIVVKDSSANKGGVITSSFEILAGLTLTEQEFLEHKSELVDEILERVKECSYLEATLLLQTHKETKKFFTDISEEISYRINLYTDQLLAYLENVELSYDPKHPMVSMYLAYAPKILRERYEKRLLTEVPDHHKKAIIATALASKLVYSKGLSWSPTVVDILPLIV